MLFEQKGSRTLMLPRGVIDVSLLLAAFLELQPLLKPDMMADGDLTNLICVACDFQDPASTSEFADPTDLPLMRAGSASVPENVWEKASPIIWGVWLHHHDMQRLNEDAATYFSKNQALLSLDVLPWAMASGGVCQYDFVVVSLGLLPPYGLWFSQLIHATCIRLIQEQQFATPSVTEGE